MGLVDRLSKLYSAEAYGSSAGQQVNQKHIDNAELTRNQHLGYLRNTASHKSKFNSLAILMLGFILCYLSVQLLSLQVTSSEELQSFAEGNRIRQNVIYAQRGRVLDRNGVVLVDNKVSFRLDVITAEVPSGEVESYIDRLAKAIDIDEVLLRDRLDIIEPNSVVPQVLLERLSVTQSIIIDQKLASFPGLVLSEIPSRRYVYPEILAHLIGYTGIVSQQDIDRAEYDLIPTDIVGKTGIELQFDEQLRGEHGFTQTEVDSLGRQVRVLNSIPPKQGEDIQLTIDIELTRRMFQLSRQQLRASDSTRTASIAIEPSSGNVLAVVSLPTFNAQDFADGISSKDFAKLQADKDTPQLNRAVNGFYPPGSTVKPLVAAAGLQEGVIDASTIVKDEGSIDLGTANQGQLNFSNFDGNEFGNINVVDALATSSNVFFFTVGGGHQSISGLGVNRLDTYYDKFGFGNNVGGSFSFSGNGLLPDPEWKRETLSSGWWQGDTYNLSIGQGDLLVSPAQLARAHAAVANRGTITNLVLREQESNGEDLRIKDEHFTTVIEGMRQSILASPAATKSFDALIKAKIISAAKSGTAEDGNRAPHAWYSGFAPVNNPDILVTSLVENGKFGSVTASPIVGGAIEEYLLRGD